MTLQIKLLRLRQFVWSPDLAALPLWSMRGIWLLRVLHVMLRQLAQGRLDLRATSLVYTTLLSLVPLLAVSFSLLKAFGIHRQFEPVLMDFFDPLGDKGHALGVQVMAFVNNLRVGVLGAVGLVLVIYTGVSLLQKTEHAFNEIWGVERARSVLRRFSDYLSILLIGPLLIVVALSLTATVTSTALVHKLLSLGELGILVAVFGKMLSYALVIAVFTMLYSFMPNTRVRLSAALVGGVVAGLLWESAGWAFTAFVVHSTVYTAVYSSFAILIMFFVWLYVSWTITLVGASIAYYAQNPGTLRLYFLERDATRLVHQARERAVLCVMLNIAAEFDRARPALTRNDLAQRCALPPERLQDALQLLLRGQWLAVTSDDPPRYLPAKALQQIEIAALWRAARGDGTNEVASKESEVDILLRDIESAASHGLQHKTLHDVVKLMLTKTQ